MPPDLVAAAKLKTEGNELFRKKDYVGALTKYSEALVLDDENAVLYANRAACNYSLNKYLDAVDDAQMATELDPDYAKGWSRLAAARDALAEWKNSVIAWHGALDALPKTNLSPAERLQKDQYTAGFKAALARVQTAEEPIIPAFKINQREGKMPWQVAAEMLPELQKNASPTNLSSSVWVILYAYEEFTQGVIYLKELKSFPDARSAGGSAYCGNLEALTYLTNGMIRDERAFHIDQPDWIGMCSKQIMFEAGVRDAWNTERLESLKQQAQIRLRENGWNDVRPALSVTVRAWIMKASLDGSVRQQPQTGVQYYRRVLDLLEWGRTVWKDVPKSDRGVIFEDTFVTGVRGSYLRMFMSAYETDPGLNSKFPLEDLKEEAEDLLKETDRLSQNPPKEAVDPGFLSSFISYPAGIAHSMIGLYHVQMSKYSSNPVESRYSFMKAAAAYLEAAKKYPEDDESHAWFLNCSLDCLRNGGVRIGDFNQVAIRLREAAPKMMKLWALSALARFGRDQRIRENLDSAEDIMKRVAEGKLTLDDPTPFRS